jgi:hypothetical protein
MNKKKIYFFKRKGAPWSATDAAAIVITGGTIDRREKLPPHI